MRQMSPHARQIFVPLTLLLLVTTGMPGPPAARANPAPSASVTPASVGAWSPTGPDDDPPPVRAVAMDGPALAESTTIVVGADNGVYRSTNGGASWSDWTGGLPGRAASALVYASGRFYVAVDGLVYRRAVGDSAWAEDSAGLPRPPGAITCLAGNAAGLLLAADCAAAPGSRLVYRRGAGQAEWQPFGEGLPAPMRITGLAVGENSLYLATLDSGVFASSAAASVWQDVSRKLPLNGNDVTALAVGPDDALYAGLTWRRAVSAAKKGGVWRLPAGDGADWDELGDLPAAAGGSVDVRVLTVAPTGAVFAASAEGQLFFGEGLALALWAWTRGASVGATPLSMTLSPQALAIPPDNTLFVGSETGLVRSQTLGRTLRAVNQGLALGFASRLIVGTPDGTLLAASTRRLYRSADGEGWATILDVEEDTITALATSANYARDGGLFVAVSGGDGAALLRSSDRGASWARVELPLAVSALAGSATIAQDSTLYAVATGTVGAGGGVLRSTNGGATWATINAGLEGRTVTTIATAPQSAALELSVLAGTSEGVFRYSAETGIWAPVGGGDTVGAVAALGLGEGALFAGGPDGLYRHSTPEGWRRLTTNLPLGDLRGLVLSPEFARDQTIVAATGAGPWLSRDGGASWQALSQGLPTNDVRALALAPGFARDPSIFAATAGGIFRYTLPPVAPPWLVLLYLAGDDTEPSDAGGPLTGLSDPLRQLVGRLDAMPYNPAMRLVVLFDGDARGDSRVLVREPEGLRPATPAPSWMPQDSELDTGGVGTLRNFIAWSRASFPGARHTFLSLLDHGGGWAPDFGTPAQPSGSRRAQGGGWRGMSLDMTSGTSLSTRGTSAALADLGRFDVLFLDACLMGMLESVYEVSPYSDYVVAGQNLLWAAFPYERYLAPDVLGATTTPRELSAAIVARYNAGDGPAEPFTIAAIESARLPELRDRTAALAEQLLAALPEGDAVPQEDPARAAITRAYSESQKFDYDVSLSLDPTDGYVDLADFAARLQQPGNTISEGVSAAAAAVVAAVDGPAGAVVASRAVSGTLVGLGAPWSFAGANGLSIYLPLGEQDRRLTGAPLAPGEQQREERQLDYYTNCNFAGCAQLALTRDAPAWARLLVRLEPGTPLRDTGARPYQNPAPLLSRDSVYLPLLAGT